MTSNQDIIDYVLDLCKSTAFSKLDINRFESGEVVLLEKRDDVTISLMMSFRLSDIGKSINSISSSLVHATLESFVKSIAASNSLLYDTAKERTITYSATNPTLYRKLTLDDVGNFEIYKVLIREFVTSEIIPFLKSRSSIKGLGEFVLQHDCSNIIKIGIGGEYPVNVLKAITLAKWCGNDARYQEYTKGLQSWIDEDRKDPNYAPKCDSYQGALNDLKKKLDSQA